MADELSYRPKTGDIPTSPGVYRYFDSTGRILYVGKAKNLRARLTSYFAPLHTLHERTRRMVTTATKVEWVTVGSEFEALQLEFTWIKEFDPPFNIQFRDDKSYPYLAITMKDDVPRVLVTRKRNIPQAKYFGPYTKTWAIRETLDHLLPVFPIRSCSDSTYNKAVRTHRACLLGDIGRCSAPCIGRISVEDHRSLATDFGDFMAGKNTTHVKELRAQMEQASAAQEYEKAAKLRDNIHALETVAAKTAVVLDESVDADMFGVAMDDLAAAVHLFKVRGGRIRGVKSWTVDTELDVTQGELIENLLMSAYSEEQLDVAQLYVPEEPEDARALEALLTEQRREVPGQQRSAAVKVRVPLRGDLAALMRTAQENATNALVLYKTQRSSDFIARTNALTDIQEALGLPEAPLRIEAFDISHLGGTNIVGSMVVFEDGLPKKADYRLFNVDEARDDTDAMNQVLARRASYLNGADADEQSKKNSFSYPPGLFLVDGAGPQVSAAAKALSDAGVTNIAVVGIAKRLEELWVPGDDNPVILPRNSDALFLIQRLRDEAHRFAITAQKKSRRKDINTVLSSVPGLGPTKVKAILQHFGSVAAIKQSDAATLQEVPGVTEGLALKIMKTLGESSGSSPQ